MRYLAIPHLVLALRRVTAALAAAVLEASSTPRVKLVSGVDRHQGLFRWLDGFLATALAVDPRLMALARRRASSGGAGVPKEALHGLRPTWLPAH